LSKPFSYKTESKMADDAGAKARLEAAVQRLETALGRIAERGGGGDGDREGLRQELGSLESDLTALRAERDGLADELTRAKAEGAALQTAMDAVSARLDNTIETVHALLDE
jgi:chromosome segregation ATPase